MKFSVIIKIFILIIIAALLVTGWLYFGPEAGPSKKIRNVLLISMDTTRADIISCYNPDIFEQPTSPNIDALAAEGVLFERTYSPISLTLPSHCTMLTGTTPLHHGLHDNQGYMLDDSNLTLAEILKDNGFVTGAIVGSIILDSKYGLDQGFDLYDDDFQNERSPIHIPERQAEETERIACEWLEEHQKENMFLFLHFYDPHKSYDAPEPYRNMFLDDPLTDPNALKDIRARMDYMRGMYAGEVAYTDNCIKGIIDKLKQLGLYDSTLIIITSDHGEMFYQHEEVTHGYFIYEGNHRIPMIFKVPGVSTPRRIEKTVGLVDIAPTVCSLMNIKGPFEFQGVDISPYLLDDEPKDLNRHIYLESLTPTKYKANSLLGIVNDKFKYIQTTRPELYDMVNDYPESVNLIETYPKETHLLKEQLKQMLDDTMTSKGKDSKMELDAETLKQFEALGYVSGSVIEEFSFDTSKKDPKDLIYYHVLNTRIRDAMVKEEFDFVRETCKKMIEIKPDLHKPYMHLAAIANKLEDYPESIKQLKKAIEIEPKETELHNLIAIVYQKHGQAEMAIESLNKSLEISPKQPDVINELAMTFYDQGKVQQAITLWHDVLAIIPDHVFAINSLGWIRATSKDEKFYDPPEALKFARRICEITEYKAPGMLDTLAAAMAANGQFDKAVETAEKAIQLAKAIEQNELAQRIQKRQDLYKERKALRE
jgi:arylsulfatase A-like enzyme